MEEIIPNLEDRSIEIMQEHKKNRKKKGWIKTERKRNGIALRVPTYALWEYMKRDKEETNNYSKKSYMKFSDFDKELI